MRRSSSLCVAALVLGFAAFASCKFTASLDGYTTEDGLGGTGGTAGGSGGTGGTLPESGDESTVGGAGGSSAGSSGDAGKLDGDATVFDGPDVITETKVDTGGLCTTEYIDCDGNEANGCEVDSTTDKNNCGACGHNCHGGECKSSTCQPLVLATGQKIPWGIGVDATTVYWSNQGASVGQGEIKSIPIAGGTIKTLSAPQSTPGDIALDTTFVYWSNYSGGGEVMKIGKDGLGLANITSGSGPWSLALDIDTVYWTNSDGSIRKAPKSGGSSNQVTSGELDPRGISVDGATVLWTSATGGKIVSANKDGTGKTDVATGQLFPISIFVTSQAIYWTNAGSYAQGSCTKNDGSVMKLVKGQPTPTKLAQDQACPLKLTVDNDNVYWTNAGTNNSGVYAYNGAVMKVAVGGGSSTAVYSGVDVIIPYGIAVDDTNVYWTTQGLGSSSGTVVRIVKK